MTSPEINCAFFPVLPGVGSEMDVVPAVLTKMIRMLATFTRTRKEQAERVSTPPFFHVSQCRFSLLTQAHLFCK